MTQTHLKKKRRKEERVSFNCLIKVNFDFAIEPLFHIFTFKVFKVFLVAGFI